MLIKTFKTRATLLQEGKKPQIEAPVVKQKTKTHSYLHFIDVSNKEKRDIGKIEEDKDPK
jgi:hypothetical protein